MIENVSHFKDLIVVPALAQVGEAIERPQFYSESAINLIMGTGIAESRLSALRQIGGGPAGGLLQIEPPTFDDVYCRYLQQESKAELLRAIRFFMNEEEPYVQVIGCMKFAVLIARVRYWMVEEKLPNHDDVDGLAYYYKKYYNTYEGKGSEAKFKTGYQRYYKGRGF